MAETIRKINILEMHSSFGYAGGQRNLFSFSKFLNKDLFEVFAASYLKGGVYEHKLSEIGVKNVSAEGSAEKVLDFIKENSIDVIHIHRSGGENALESKILEGAKLINPKMVIVEKNIFGKYDGRNFDIIDCSFFQSMMHLNERYIPASGRSFDPEKMKVLYNMVDAAEFEKYRLAPTKVAEVRQKYGLKEDDFVIGRIGRPDLAKWSDITLDSIPYLKKLVPNFKFIFMGVPRSRVKKIEGSSLKDHVIVLKPSSDEQVVHEFYQIIDVLGHMTKSGECNGNTINEAMFWGKPVVVNSTPRKDNGQLEQVEHMVDGIIANYPQNFSRAVAFLNSDKKACAAMGQKGRERVLRFNDPRSIVGNLEKFLVEKMRQNNEFLNLSATVNYAKIAYYPAEEMIREYKQKYAEKLQQDFGELSLRERFVHAVRFPIRYGRKLRDFVEHKLGYERD